MMYFLISLSMLSVAGYNNSNLEYNAIGPYFSLEQCENAEQDYLNMAPVEQGSRATVIEHNTACIGTPGTSSQKVKLVSIAAEYNSGQNSNMDSFVLPAFYDKAACQAFANNIETTIQLAGVVWNGKKRYIDTINTCLTKD